VARHRAADRADHGHRVLAAAAADLMADHAAEHATGDRAGAGAFAGLFDLVNRGHHAAVGARGRDPCGRGLRLAHGLLRALRLRVPRCEPLGGGDQRNRGDRGGGDQEHRMRRTPRRRRKRVRRVLHRKTPCVNR